MLVVASAAQDLRQLEGGIDVIKEMALTVQSGAKLITEYMETPFYRTSCRSNTYYRKPIISVVDRAARSVLSSELSDRIQGCRKRCIYLNEQFNQQLHVQNWRLLRKFDGIVITQANQTNAFHINISFRNVTTATAFFF
jgi:hypothetical protein